MTKSTISRRKLLSTAATGSIALAGAVSGVSSLNIGQASAMTTNVAPEYWTKVRTSQYLCSQIHYSKSLELASIVESPNLDEADKNLAIKTAKCPSCGVQIHPSAEHTSNTVGI